MANITPNNNAICDLKCKYTFNYTDSDVSVRNESNAIMCEYIESFQPSAKDSVTYSSNTYNPYYFSIIYPSFNKYNGKLADAEIIILHKSKTAGDLLVCIPILISKETIPSSQLLGQIIDKAYTNSLITNTKDKNYTLSNKINLNDLIPMNKYYTDKFKYNSNSSTEHNIIVFSIDDKSYITIKPDHYQKLIKTIKRNTTFSSSIKFTNSLFSNINGPTKAGGATEDDIYIDCKPYIEDDINGYDPDGIRPSQLSNESVSSSKSKKKSNTSIKNFLSGDFTKSPLFIIIIVIVSIIFISLIMIGLYKFLNKTSQAAALAPKVGPNTAP